MLLTSLQNFVPRNQQIIMTALLWLIGTMAKTTKYNTTSSKLEWSFKLGTRGLGGYRESVICVAPSFPVFATPRHHYFIRHWSFLFSFYLTFSIVNTSFIMLVISMDSWKSVSMEHHSTGTRYMWIMRIWYSFGPHDQSQKHGASLWSVFLCV